MIFSYLLLMLFVSNPSRPMMPTSMYSCSNSTLTIYTTRNIATMQVSWNFFSNSGDHSTTALVLPILDGCWVLEFHVPCLVLLYRFRLIFGNSFLIIFYSGFTYQMYRSDYRVSTYLKKSLK